MAQVVLMVPGAQSERSLWLQPAKAACFSLDYWRGQLGHWQGSGTVVVGCWELRSLLSDAVLWDWHAQQCFGHPGSSYPSCQSVGVVGTLPPNKAAPELGSGLPSLLLVEQGLIVVGWLPPARTAFHDREKHTAELKGS